MTVATSARLDMQGFVAHLEDKGLAPATTRQAYLQLSGLLTAAVDAGLIAASPSRNINLPTPRRSEMRFLSPEEVAELATVIDPRYRALVMTAAYTGCRFGELAGLHRRHVDTTGRRLTVARTLSDVNGTLTITAPKTAAARRRIALPQLISDELDVHMDTYPPATAGLVFTSTEGDAIRRRNFRRRVWLPAVRGSVGEPMRFHDLRHTHAAILIAQGEHPKVIQTRLGHSSIQITLDTYGHLVDGLDEAAAERLDHTIIIPNVEPQQSRVQDVGLDRPRL